MTSVFLAHSRRIGSKAAHGPGSKRGYRLMLARKLLKSFEPRLVEHFGMSDRKVQAAGERVAMGNETALPPLGGSTGGGANWWVSHKQAANVSGCDCLAQGAADAAACGCSRATHRRVQVATVGPLSVPRVNRCRAISQQVAALSSWCPSHVRWLRRHVDPFAVLRRTCPKSRIKRRPRPWVIYSRVSK